MSGTPYPNFRCLPIWEFYLTSTVPTRAKYEKQTATCVKQSDIIVIFKWRLHVMFHLRIREHCLHQEAYFKY